MADCARDEIDVTKLSSHLHSVLNRTTPEVNQEARIKIDQTEDAGRARLRGTFFGDSECSNLRFTCCLDAHC